MDTRTEGTRHTGAGWADTYIYTHARMQAHRRVHSRTNGHNHWRTPTDTHERSYIHTRTKLAPVRTASTMPATKAAQLRESVPRDERVRTWAPPSQWPRYAHSIVHITPLPSDPHTLTSLALRPSLLPTLTQHTPFLLLHEHISQTRAQPSPSLSLSLSIYLSIHLSIYIYIYIYIYISHTHTHTLARTKLAGN